MLEGLNSSRHEEVTRLRNAGLTFAEIGRRLGISKERARQIAKSEKAATKKKPVPNHPDALLTVGQAAELLNVHVNTIRRWSNEGLLETQCVGSRGDRRFRRRDIDNLLLKKSARSH